MVVAVERDKSLDNDDLPDFGGVHDNRNIVSKGEHGENFSGSLGDLHAKRPSSPAKERFIKN